MSRKRNRVVQVCANAKHSFKKILARRVTGFIVAGIVGYAIFHITGHPIAFLALAERSLDWIGASMSDAIIESGD